MRQFYAIFLETFLSLRRDKVFPPAMIGGIIWLWFSIFVGEWTFTERRQLIIELGNLGLHIIGVVVAIQWGTKLIQDAKRDGAIEVQMASPISRSTWLAAKLSGLFAVLCAIGIVLGVAWSLMMPLYGWKPLSAAENWAVAFQLLTWLILGTVSIFVSCFANSGVALFVTLSTWVVGLASQYMLTALPKNSSPAIVFFAEGMATIWNLSRFNITEKIYFTQYISVNEITSILSYGFLLIGVFLISGFLVFAKKDVI